MRRNRQPGPGALVLAVLCVVGLVVAHAQSAPVAVRAPLALVAFLVTPGFGLLRALRLRADGPMAAALVLALSLAVDLLSAELLLTLHVATVRNLLLTIGGVSLMCLLACTAATVRERTA